MGAVDDNVDGGAGSSSEDEGSTLLLLTLR